MRLPICFFAILLLASCFKDDCKNVTCTQYGRCLKGKCDCDYDHDGEKCETAYVSHFVGTYIGQSVSLGNVPMPDTVSIISREPNELDLSVKSSNTNYYGSFYTKISYIVMHYDTGGTINDSLVESAQFSNYDGKVYHNISFNYVHQDTALHSFILNGSR